MDKSTTNDIQGQIPQVVRTLDELAREGARRMIEEALELEVEEYIQKLRHRRDENGCALVVRNGKARPRTVSLGAGPVELQAPRVDDQRFTSRILPPYMRRSPRLSDALPALYLRGLSTGDFEEAIPALLGADAAGFSASSISRLTSVWQEEHEGWSKRPLTGKEYVYVWADGVYFGVRLGEDKQLACLVLIGVLPDGTKEVIALQDGYRESTDSWLSLLRDLKGRGWLHPDWRLATVRWAFGQHCGKSIQEPKSSAAGYTRSPTSSTSCRNECSPGQRTCCTRSCTRPTGPVRGKISSASVKSSRPSIPKQWSAC